MAPLSKQRASIELFSHRRDEERAGYGGVLRYQPQGSGSDFDPFVIERYEKEAARYRALQKDPELLAFHARHDPGKRVTREDMGRAVAVLRATFRDREVDIARGA